MAAAAAYAARMSTTEPEVPEREVPEPDTDDDDDEGQTPGVYRPEVEQPAEVRLYDQDAEFFGVPI